jgi:hypothetical protein
MNKAQALTAAVIAYEGSLASMPWSKREPIAAAFADAYARKSKRFDRAAFMAACQRESEKDANR